jgi:death on curing protein
VSEPIWVPLQAILIIHDRQIARHGGAAGMRDMRLLQGAVERPRNKFAYEQAKLEEIAAAYAFGIAKAHAFVDGNKRTAFVTCATFLRLNGFGLRPDPLSGVQAMEDLAAGIQTEEEFGIWLAGLMVTLDG